MNQSCPGMQMIQGRKQYSKSVKINRLIWNIVWNLLIRPLPRWLGNHYRNGIYRCFGAKIGKHSGIYPSVKVFMPWNLVMGDWSVIGEGVECYNAAPVIVGDYCVISERAFICTASHNIHSAGHEQIERPIVLHNRSWVAADAFIGMGVTIGEGAVVGARAAVFKDVEPWTVVGGNPAKFIKKRVMTDHNCDKA